VLFQVLHEVLPMSRVVNGFREATTGDLSSVFVTSVTYRVVLIALNVAMATWGAARQRTWTITRLHPDVSL
jgi:putative membrane protein